MFLGSPDPTTRFDTKENGEITALRQENKQLREEVQRLRDILTKVQQLVSLETVNVVPCLPLIQSFSPPSELPPSYEKEDALDFISQAAPLIHLTAGSRILKNETTISALAVLPNGQLASAGYRTVNIWDLRTDKRMLTREFASQVGSLELLPKNQLACGSNYTIHILDVLTGSSRPPLGGKEIMHGTVNHLKSLPDGKLANSILDRNTIWIWDIDKGHCVQTFNNGDGHNTSITCLALSSDGALLESGSANGVFKLWNSKTYECIRTLLLPSAHSNHPICVQLLPHDALAIGFFDGTIKIYGPQTNNAILTLTGPNAPVRCLVLLPNGMLVSASQNGTVILWNPKTGEYMQTLKEGPAIIEGQRYHEYPQCLQLVPGGLLLVDPCMKKDGKGIAVGEDIAVDILALDLKEEMENEVVGAIGNVVVSASTANVRSSQPYTPLRDATTITTVSATDAAKPATPSNDSGSKPKPAM